MFAKLGIARTDEHVDSFMIDVSSAGRIHCWYSKATSAVSSPSVRQENLVVDISGDDPAEAMRTVQAELEAYGAGLADKPQLIALNKVDLADQELAEGFAAELREAGADRVFVISGASGEGIEELLDAVLAHLPDRTSTETKGSEVEDVEGDGAGEWSPL